MIMDEGQYLAAVGRKLPAAERVLVFAPHPDDEIIGCGGAMALLRGGGAEVTVVIVTDGARGGSDRENLPARRAAESRQAAAVLGVSAPLFWNYPDRGLVYGEELIERIAAQVRGSGADLVFLPAPTEIHPDHQSLALAGAEAVRRLAGRIHVAFCEIGAPLSNPNLLIDITPVQKRKREALTCFASQLREQPYAERAHGLNLFRALHLGAEAESAEAFVLAAASQLNRGLTELFSGMPAYRRRLGFAAFPEDIPLVSIVVRSMDRPTLTDALDSLSRQTYGHAEVVVVNAKGGEHSPLGEWCGRFPLRLINQGGEPLSRGRAANQGMEDCHGVYLGFLDDDDTLDPDHISPLVAALQASSGEVVAYSGVRGLRRNDPEGKVLKTFAETKASFPKLLLGNFIPIHAPLFPASLRERGLAFDESLEVYEDWDFWLQAARLVPFVFTNQVTGNYFQGGESEVSPLYLNRDVVRLAKRRFFCKWLDLVSPEEFVDAAEHHQEAVSDEKTRWLDACKKLAESEAVSATLEGRLHQAAEDMKKQQFLLDELLSSRSWRMTAPLRELRRCLRSILRHRTKTVS